jgi:hypothetical protein
MGRCGVREWSATCGNAPVNKSKTKNDPLKAPYNDLFGNPYSVKTHDF